MTIGEKYPFVDYAFIHRASVELAQKMRKLPAPNSPNGTHYMVEIDHGFWCHLEGFVRHDYFVGCFNGIFSIVQLKGSTKMYIMVHADDIAYFSAKPLTRVKLVRIHK